MAVATTISGQRARFGTGLAGSGFGLGCETGVRGSGITTVGGVSANGRTAGRGAGEVCCVTIESAAA